jgi:hypothetical protein
MATILVFSNKGCLDKGDQWSFPPVLQATIQIGGLVHAIET